MRAIRPPGPLRTFAECGPERTISDRIEARNDFHCQETREQPPLRRRAGRDYSANDNRVRPSEGPRGRAVMWAAITQRYHSYAWRRRRAGRFVTRFSRPRTP